MTVEVKGEAFDMIIHFSPSDRLGAPKKEEIHGFFKDNRLKITTELIDENLKTKNWDAVLYAKNRAVEDGAVCTLQWAPWCAPDGAPRLWIHDVSRLGTVKGTTSPVKVLMDQCKTIARRAGLKEVYLLVDEADKATVPSGWRVLTGIYSKVNYGFATNVEGCVVGETTYTVMKSPV